MSQQVGAVIFEDGSRLYLIFDDAHNQALRPLFASVAAARAWLDRGLPSASSPKTPEPEEAVRLITDIALEADQTLLPHISFASRASRQAMWLTGPRSFMEMIYENGATACREF